MFSAFNPSKCTHTWSSGQPTLRRPGSSWGFGALLKGLTSVVDNSCRSRGSNPQPRVTSPTLYPLEPRLPVLHSSLTHKNGNYVRLLFIYYSSAFNTIVPIKLVFSQSWQSLPHASRVIELKMRFDSLTVSEFSSSYCTSESIA